MAVLMGKIVLIPWILGYTIFRQTHIVALWWVRYEIYYPIHIWKISIVHHGNPIDGAMKIRTPSFFGVNQERIPWGLTLWPIENGSKTASTAKSDGCFTVRKDESCSQGISHELQPFLDFRNRLSRLIRLPDLVNVYSLRTWKWPSRNSGFSHKKWWIFP